MANRQTWLRIVDKFKKEGIIVHTPFSNEQDDDQSEYAGLNPGPLSWKKKQVAKRVDMTSAPQDHGLVPQAPDSDGFEELAGRKKLCPYRFLWYFCKLRISQLLRKVMIS